MSRTGEQDGAMPGVYVHIPYCASKCNYCSFNSYEARSGVPAEYVEAIIADIRRSAPGWSGVEFGSVYFGGGTPSLLDPGDLGRILSALGGRLSVARGAEITLEANPSSLSPRKLCALGELGINRLSVGVQSLYAGELDLLGRLHTPGEALGAIESARAAGFTNISSDIMLGVPGQTRSSLASMLSRLAPLVTHVSCYLLSVDPGTRLYDLVMSGAVTEMGEDEVAGLYETGASELARLGFERYEISNWARPGLESRHNLMYWSRGDYLGLGAGASSHRSGLRSRRIDRPEAYMCAVLGGGDPVHFRETVTTEGALCEEVMLSLRTARGLDLDRLATEYSLDLRHAGLLLDRLSSGGLIVRRRKGIQLSPKGILVSDYLIGDLLSALTLS